MRRFAIVAAIALLFTVAALLLFVCVPDATGISQHSYDRIEIGMSENETIAIIGLPPGDHRTEALGFRHVEIVKNHHFREKEWIGDDGDLYVWCDDDGVVRDKLYQQTRELSPWSKIRDRVRGLLQR